MRNFLRKNPRKQKKQEDNERKTQKGAISNLVRKGPFLFWFDNRIWLRAQSSELRVDFAALRGLPPRHSGPIVCLHDSPRASAEARISLVSSLKGSVEL